jgi:hypothetical protein
MPDRDIVVTDAIHLAKIAADAGFKDWNTLWNKAGNATLRGNRANALKLFHGDRVTKPGPPAPGDTVKVPDLERKEESKPADNGAPHKFKVVRTKIFLRLRVLDDKFQPLPVDARWQLTLDGVQYPREGPAAFEPEGRINVEVRPGHTGGKLTVKYNSPGYKEKASDPDPPPVPIEVVFPIAVGRLDPIQENAPVADCVAGVQQRLNNLGFNAGPVDGVIDDETRAAIGAFQTKFTPGTVDGAPATVQPKLHEIHDTPTVVPP